MNQIPNPEEWGESPAQKAASLILYPELFTPEQIEALRAACLPFVDSYMRIGQAMMEGVGAAVRSFAEAMAPAWNDILALAAEYNFFELDNDEVETAYRAEADRYNAYHRSRKVSWRRLNREQRIQAIQAYISERSRA